ncbi:DsrE/DsrF/DrsH-like family protein [Halobacteriales archaeon Cl-PHB]
MSTDTPTQSETDPEFDAEDVAALADRVEELEEDLAAVETDTGDGQKKMTIIATKGSLDMAYPPLILASTAAAFGWDVVVFHTFWALDVLHEEKAENLKLSAVGNPSMPMPNALAALPGMDSLATKMMRKKIDDNGTASIQELIDLSLDSGVDLQACQMTMELMDYEDEDMIDGVTTQVGAATALEHMADADIQLLV